MTNKYVSEFAGVFFFLALCLLGLLALGFGDATQPIIATIASTRAALALGLAGFALLLVLTGRIFRGVVLILLAAGFYGQVVYFAFEHASTAPAQGKELKVISFNILGGNIKNGKRIADFLISQRPDIAFIQEANPVFPYLADLEKVLPYHIGCSAQPKCDLLFLSRYRLRDVTENDLSWKSTNRLYTAIADIDGTPLQIVAPHLTKPYFPWLQPKEFRKLAETVNKTSGPLLMAGDFNSAAWAPYFAKFLDDTGLKLAPHETGTWPVFAGALGVPIDHVLVRQPAGIVEAGALPDNFGSNHRGLHATIRIAPQN